MLIRLDEANGPTGIPFTEKRSFLGPQDKNLALTLNSVCASWHFIAAFIDLSKSEASSNINDSICLCINATHKSIKMVSKTFFKLQAIPEGPETALRIG